MPKKKKGKGKQAPLFTPEELAGFIEDYKRNCQEMGNIVPNEQILAQLCGEEESVVEEFKELNQVLVSDESLGRVGTRALSTAILGIDARTPARTPFRGIRSLRLNSSRVGCDGVASLAEILRIGGADAPISYLELKDNEIQPRGCRALGGALMYGNKSLLYLDLSYNPILSEGARFLCKGLRSNSTLAQLHLVSCGLDENAAAHIGDALAYPMSGMILLNISGNCIADEGLRNLCPGLQSNSKLEVLDLSSCRIGSHGDDRAIRCVQGHRARGDAHP